MFLQAMIIHNEAKKNIKIVWLLLDNQSTYDIFSNTHLLKEICHSKGALYCNSLQHREAPRNEGGKS